MFVLKNIICLHEGVLVQINDNIISAAERMVRIMKVR